MKAALASIQEFDVAIDFLVDFDRIEFLSGGDAAVLIMISFSKIFMLLKSMAFCFM